MECPNCGYVMPNNEKVCKYCGTANSEYSFAKSVKELFVPPVPAEKETKTQPLTKVNTTSYNNTSKKSKLPINIFVFILLLIIFWPAAIIYLIYKIAVQ